MKLFFTKFAAPIMFLALSTRVCSGFVIPRATGQYAMRHLSAAATAEETIRKTGLVDSVVAKTGLSKKDSEACVDAFLESIAEEITSGNKVNIAGFGTFKRADRKARTGRNPKTGEALQIAAKKAPTFSAAKKFKEQVNGDI
uniref:DNA-binding protein HU n=1 Tax=Thalassionema nitzschioides TaxID=33649 RepID=A0A6V0ZTX2_9STRA|mmetsp:Transcript_9435/g.7764  ORF Transcript_9435/g.7764 Transcript_9435/m.7764 type:complete len:142 (+) Transcript_9435:112-537(+)